MIEPIHPQLSIVRQCGLLGLARSSYYYQEAPESEENLHLMRLLDEQYTRTPFYGIGKMTAWLRSLGYEVNQVWSTDITYIRLHHGFVYLVAMLDWFSRSVLSWEVSITLDTSFCLEALDQALCVATPEIFNSDQGVQFTSIDFTKH